MKSKLFASLVIVLLSACATMEVSSETDSDTRKTCGVSDPAQNLPWLKELISKAEADKKTKEYKGNYIGQIYQTTWRNQDAFWTNFMMGSGGIYARIYACDGQRIIPNDTNPSLEEIEEIKNTLSKDKLIYSNLP